MRLIWTTSNIDLFRTFAKFLESKNIAFTIEEKVDRDWSSDSYANKEFLLWIYEEDDFEKAQKHLTTFLQDPENSSFSQTQTPRALLSQESTTNFVEYKVTPDDDTFQVEPELPKSKTRALLSTLLLLLTSFVFLFDMAGERSLNSTPLQVKSMLITSSPVKRALLYDYPQSYALLDTIVSLYGYDVLLKPQELPPAGKLLYNQYKNEAKWQGFYPYLVTYTTAAILNETPETLAKKEALQKAFEDVQLFEKEKQGQLWRLFTPILLHNDILHIFFNMIWLLLLCPQMEVRMGRWKLFTFILVAALFSNTAQYLMTGPHFIGFSGIICAMVFFMRRRQQLAPWEGYVLTRSTFAFICFFIGILATLSFLAFIFQVFSSTYLTLAIANSAHLAGAFIGFLLGSMRFFKEA